MFALCAAVCLNLFGAAGRMSSESDNLNHAVSLSKSAANCYKAADGDLLLCGRLMDVPEDEMAKNRLIVYYDARWKPISVPSDEGFYLLLEQQMAVEHESIRKAEITVNHMSGEQIFSLTVKKAVVHAGGELYAP